MLSARGRAVEWQDGRGQTPHPPLFSDRQAARAQPLPGRRPTLDGREAPLATKKGGHRVVVEDAGAASSSYCCGAGFLLLSKKGRGAFLLCTRKGLAPGLADPLSPAGTCRRDNQRIGVSNSLSQGPPSNLNLTPLPCLHVASPHPTPAASFEGSPRPSLALPGPSPWVARWRRPKPSPGDVGQLAGHLRPSAYLNIVNS